MNTIEERIKQTYAQLNSETVHSDLLAQLYAEDIQFIDPLHAMSNREQLKDYFINLYRNVEHIHFNFTSHISSENTVFLTWIMTFRHPKLNGGKDITVPGTSHIKHNDQYITFHQDYFDSTHMLFSQIPVLKNIINAIKNRLN